MLDRILSDLPICLGFSLPPNFMSFLSIKNKNKNSNKDFSAHAGNKTKQKASSTICVGQLLLNSSYIPCHSIED